MTDRIELLDLRVDAVVGALPFERERPQSLSLDLVVERSFAEAASRDDLTLTTNYAALLALAQAVVVDGQFVLLETLVYRVAEALLASDPAIEAATVTVRKLLPPVAQQVASVGASTTQRRG